MRLMLSMCALLLSLSACSKDKIPNTDVEDSPEAREVISFVEQYRAAVTERNVAGLIKLTSKDYYDDMGTPSGEDDVDQVGLTERLKETFAGDLLSVHYDIRYRDVIFLPTQSARRLHLYRPLSHQNARWHALGATPRRQPHGVGQGQRR